MYSSDICILWKWDEETSCSFSGLNNGCNDCVLTVALDLKVMNLFVGDSGIYIGDMNWTLKI